MIQIVMPMAGDGQRFKDKGIETLKPLIKINSQYMFEHAIASIGLESTDKLFLVIKQSDQQKYQLQTALKSIIPQGKIHLLPAPTQGPLETCFFIKDQLNSLAPLLILDCDLHFQAADYQRYIRRNNFPASDGGALCHFNSQEPRYSYALAQNKMVIQTAEKKVISNQALIGAYFFCRAKDFIDCAQDQLNKKAGPYISPLYNQLIAKKLAIHLFSAEIYKSYGTPEELALYCSHDN